MNERDVEMTEKLQIKAKNIHTGQTIVNSVLKMAIMKTDDG